jgi:response regulator RpfG family c-di-GMP phosphodiesterase
MRFSENKRVMVVEDDQSMRAFMQEILEGGGYDCAPVESPLRALSMLIEDQPVDLIFSDIKMPGIDGIEFLRSVKSLTPGTPVVLVSGSFEVDLGLDAVLGGAADYLYKPVLPEAILQMVQRHLAPSGLSQDAKVAESIAALIAQGGDKPLQTAQILELLEAIELKRYETLQHSHRVADYSVMLGGRYGMAPAELEDLRVGALLHDIGKIVIPHNVLMKPGPLNEEEWKVMRMHPKLGWDLVGGFPSLGSASRIVLSHHERWDGRGYPDGIAGLEIPLGARIFSVIDSLDAMLSDRPYRAGRPLAEARVEIDSMSGTQFDPAVVDAFRSISDSELLEIGRRHPDQFENLG